MPASRYREPPSVDPRDDRDQDRQHDGQRRRHLCGRGKNAAPSSCAEERRGSSRSSSDTGLCDSLADEPRSTSRASTTPRSSTRSTHVARLWSPSTARCESEAQLTGAGEAATYSPPVLVQLDSWNGVVADLQRRGYAVIAVANPLHSSPTGLPRGRGGRLTDSHAEKQESYPALLLVVPSERGADAGGDARLASPATVPSVIGAHAYPADGVARPRLLSTFPPQQRQAMELR